MASQGEIMKILRLWPAYLFNGLYETAIGLILKQFEFQRPFNRPLKGWIVYSRAMADRPLSITAAGTGLFGQPRAESLDVLCLGQSCDVDIEAHFTGIIKC